METKNIKAFGTEAADAPLKPMNIERRSLLPNDVKIEIHEQMSKYAKGLHFILDTVSAAHDANAYLNLLKVDGALVLVGAPMEPLPVTSFSLNMGRRSFAGSNIGGIAETQEMLDFCAEHNITADMGMINIRQTNEACERLLKGDVRYRFVIDMASLKK